jgi:hypothetical protein
MVLRLVAALVVKLRVHSYASKQIPIAVKTRNLGLGCRSGFRSPSFFDRQLCGEVKDGRSVSGENGHRVRSPALIRLTAQVVMHMKLKRRLCYLDARTRVQASRQYVGEAMVFHVGQYLCDMGSSAICKSWMARDGVRASTYCHSWRLLLYSCCRVDIRVGGSRSCYSSSTKILSSETYLVLLQFTHYAFQIAHARRHGSGHRSSTLA